MSQGNPSICCYRTDCAYNQCCSCMAKHIMLGQNGSCGTYVDKSRSAQKEIEVRCRPYDLKYPVVLICYSDIEQISAELQQLGFRREPEPATGLLGQFKRSETPRYVWAFHTDFEGLADAQKHLQLLPYQFLNYISSEEKKAWEKNKKYMEMAQAEKDLMKANLMPPQKPYPLNRGFWNGKIYGVTGREFVYVDGEKYGVSEQVADSIRQYQSALTVYKQQFEDLRRYG